MTKTRVLILSVLAVLCVAISFVLVAEYKKLSSKGEVNVEEQTPEVTPGEAVAPEPVVHLGGIVKEVSGDSITVTIISLGGEDLDPSLAERTVTVADGTTITLTTVPDPEGARREMDAFQAELGEYMAAVKKYQDENGLEAKLPEELVPPTPPTSTFEREEVTVSALEVGQLVSVLADKDVRTEKSFTAKSIEILPPAPAEVTPTKPAE